MRRSPLLLMVLIPLAACATHREEFSTKPPGLNVADAALQSGEPGIALSVADDTLKRNPNDTAALLRRAEAYAALGRSGMAEADYRRVLAADPHSEPAAMGLGRIELKRNPKAAEQLFYQVTQAHDRNASAWSDLGVARDLLGNHAGAQDAYRKALAAAPDMRAAQINLARSMAISRGEPLPPVQ